MLVHKTQNISVCSYVCVCGCARVCEKVFVCTVISRSPVTKDAELYCGGETSQKTNGLCYQVAI